MNDAVRHVSRGIAVRRTRRCDGECVGLGCVRMSAQGQALNSNAAENSRFRFPDPPPRDPSRRPPFRSPGHHHRAPPARASATHTAPCPPAPARRTRPLPARASATHTAPARPRQRDAHGPCPPAPARETHTAPLSPRERDAHGPGQPAQRDWPGDGEAARTPCWLSRADDDRRSDRASRCHPVRCQAIVVGAPASALDRGTARPGRLPSPSAPARPAPRPALPRRGAAAPAAPRQRSRSTLRDEAAPEAERARLGDARGELGDGAHLAGQADLAEDHELGRHRPRRRSAEASAR